LIKNLYPNLCHGCVAINSNVYRLVGIRSNTEVWSNRPNHWIRLCRPLWHYIRNYEW